MSNPEQQQSKRFFIPDFCQTQSVFIVILVAELLAILLSLARFDNENFWTILAFYSLFIQWVALISAACLCLLRGWLRNLSDIKAGTISYVIILLITLIASLLAEMIQQWIEPAIPGTKVNPVLANLMVAAILAAFWLRLFYLQAQYRLRIQAETEAKLQALQARIKPHFLFNSMNILSSLIAIQPDKAEQVVDDLSTLFRASLREHREMVSLTEEIKICKHYFHIESLRLGDRMTVDWQIEGDITPYKVPSLLLQPLVENAVYHGIQPLVEGGTISIVIQATAQRLDIIIRNPFDAKSHNDRRGNKVAVSNISDRLALLYGEDFTFTRQELEREYVVNIQLPLSEQDPS